MLGSAGRLSLVWLWLTLLFAAAPVQAQPQFPPLSGRVVDAANIIPDAEEAALDQKLAALETQSQRQLVVATIPDLQGYEISDYGYQLGRAWGLGDKGRNDGAVLIVAPNERKVRIEVGYGLEPVLTDALSSQIIAQEIVPRFKANDYPGGISAGVDRLATILRLPPDEAQKVAAAAAAQARSDEGDGGIPLGTILWIGFILFFFVLPMLRGQRGGRRYRGSGLGPLIVWDALNSASRGGGGWSGGGGSFGGGGFGGGGFSGGGGSFGGGGASGSW